MQHFNVALIATSKAGLDIWYNNLCTQASSRGCHAQDLRKLANIRKIKLGGDRAECPVSLPEKKTSVIAAKNYSEADIKGFWSSPILIYFFTLFDYFF